MRRSNMKSLFVAMACLLGLQGVAFAQPTVLESGFKLQVFTDCGRTFVPHPLLNPHQAADSECSPAETWGKEILFVSRIYSYDDFGGHIESIDRHGSVAWVTGAVMPTAMAIPPPGAPQGHDLWFNEEGSLTRLSPDGTRISIGGPSAHSTEFSALDFDGSGLFSPLAHIAAIQVGIFVLEPHGDPLVRYFPVLFAPFRTGGQMRFGPGGDWGTDLYNNGHIILPDGSIHPFPASFQNFDWADGIEFGGDMYSGKQIAFGNMTIDRIKPGGTYTPWATGLSPGHVSYCDGSLWIIGTDCTKITPLSIIDPPMADAGPDISTECLCPSGTDVLLSGALSNDDNSTPGTNDDIGKFEWFIDYGLPSELFLGEGEELTAPFSLGSHAVTLLVTDATDETSTDELVVQVVNANRPPVADAGADIQAECTSVSGAGILTLDGTGSSDPDSTAGTQDDIIKYEWFDLLSGPANEFLGTGSVLSVDLGIGVHQITLLVTDASGLTDSDVMVLNITDTTSPGISVSVSPEVIPVRTGLLTPITATVSTHDLCGDSSFVLKSIVSSEPAGGQGGGDTANSQDIYFTDFGLPDLEFHLRAERYGTGPGRTYTITYEALDAAGNLAEATATVLVPHHREK